MNTRAKSGGGITSNKFVQVGVKGGSPRANVISPGGADQQGQAMGKRSAVQPLMAGTAAAPVPLGNAVATNVGAGGPGKGRTIHESGSQGKR
jgi:hypothetical protein